MEINQILCKSIINKSNIPGMDFCINPYSGCAHACAYCYARFMKRFTGDTGKWGSFVHVKINAPEILKKQIGSRSGKFRKGTVFLSSVTDAYQPLEAKYKLTRQMLEILADSDLEVSILTKSQRVIRDADILSNMPSCEVGFSVNTMDEDFSSIIEPAASSPRKRIEALRILREKGIRNYVFISPIFPGFTNITEIVDNVKDYADCIMAEILNFRCGNWSSIREALEKHYPEKFDALKKNIRKPETWESMERELVEGCKKYGIKYGGFFYH